MPPYGPISRRDLIAALRRAGFEGPWPSSKHQYMLRHSQRVTLPNPHRGDVGTNLLAKILRQAAIDREQWNKL